MKANYPRAIANVLKWEGGKSDDKDDNGGRTNQGVTQRVYDGWRRNKGLPTRDVYDIDPLERDDIYSMQYWAPVKGDLLPTGVDAFLLDSAVHSGPVQAIKWLQRSLQPAYSGKIDGLIGQATIAAVNSFGSIPTLIARMADRRMAFLKQLSDWRKYGKGWTNRVNGAENFALALLGTKSKHTASNAIPLFGSNVTAPIEKLKELPSKTVGDIATGSGAATGSIAAMIESLRASIEPMAHSSSFITNIVVALAVTGTALAAGGVVYSRYQAAKARARADALDLPVAVPA